MARSGGTGWNSAWSHAPPIEHSTSTVRRTSTMQTPSPRALNQRSKGRFQGRENLGHLPQTSRNTVSYWRVSACSNEFGDIGPMGTNDKNSLALWEKYGDYLLMAMPYADGLIEEARGCYLRDVDGNEILDLAAGQFCSILGHNHPKLIAKITEQMQRVLHIGTQFLSPVVLEAAAKFADVAPSKKLKKSLFLSTGTEANECAISIAKMFTGKTGVIGISRGYYGLSLTVKSLTTIFTQSSNHGDLPRVPDTYNVLAPYCFRCPVHRTFPECNLECLEVSIESGLAGGDNIAAIIVEPIISAGGMIVPPPGYLKAIKKFAENRGALLI